MSEMGAVAIPSIIGNAMWGSKNSKKIIYYENMDFHWDHQVQADVIIIIYCDIVNEKLVTSKNIAISLNLIDFDN